MENPVLVLGLNSTGRTALEILLSNEVVVYGLLEEEAPEDQKDINGVSVLGSYSDESYLSLIGDRCEYFIASDEQSFKKHLAQRIEDDFKRKAINIIAASSVIAQDAAMGHGNLVEPMVQIGANATVGEYCNIKSGAIIGVSASIGDYVQIGKGAIIGDAVELGEGVFVGAGVVIVDGVKIGNNARIGAGSVVVGAVEEDKTVFGNPATAID